LKPRSPGASQIRSQKQHSAVGSFISFHAPEFASTVRKFCVSYISLSIDISTKGLSASALKVRLPQLGLAKVFYFSAWELSEAKDGAKTIPWTFALCLFMSTRAFCPMR
jgi:hypothetical protein